MASFPGSQAAAPSSTSHSYLTVEPLPLSASETTIRAAITPCECLPVPKRYHPGRRLEQREIKRLQEEISWATPVGLFGYSHDGYYKDLWCYFDRADTTSPVNKLVDRAFRMYGLGGMQVRGKPTFAPIRGPAIICKMEPDPNFAPPPPFVYNPVLSVDDIYNTLVFFRDNKKSAHRIALARDAQRLKNQNPMLGMGMGMGMLSAHYASGAGNFRKASSLARDDQQCAHCGKTEAMAGKLMRCPCYLVKYCSAECQREDRSRHKMACKNALKLKENNSQKTTTTQKADEKKKKKKKKKKKGKKKT